MTLHSVKRFRVLALGAGIAILAGSSWAHVTFRPSQPIPPGGSAEISMVVPTERSVDTVSVALELPEAFLKAGGRLTRVDFPAGWQVKIVREDKPDDIYNREMDQRAKRTGESEHEAPAPKTPAQQKEEQAANDLRRKWIKSVTFEGGTIPPDGFKIFTLDFQLPETPGVYRFPAVQTYASGEVVSWSELVKGAQHPAPSLTLAVPKRTFDYQRLALPTSVLALLVSLMVLFAQTRKRSAA